MVAAGSQTSAINASTFIHVCIQILPLSLATFQQVQLCRATFQLTLASYIKLANL